MSFKEFCSNTKQSFLRWRANRSEEKKEEGHEKWERGHRAVLIVLCVLFALYALTIVYPIGWMLFNSVKDKTEFMDNPWPLPQVWKFSNYVEVFRLFNLWSMLFNSLSLSLTIPTVSLFVTCCVSYAVAKYRFPGRQVLYFIAILIMFIPTTGSLPVTFRLMNDLQLYDTLPGMIIRGASGFGMNFLILYGIFSGVSNTYAEAAKIDGASNWRVFVQIMMPQAKSTMFAVWILAFIGNWNDYASAYMFYPSHETLAVGLKRVSDSITTAGDYILDYPKLFAAVIITITPVIIIFAACQKQIIRLNMGGGIKG